MHSGHHQLAFVVLSIIVAILGSWTALDLQRQVRAHGGRVRLYWLSATAFAMGLSIFSMHFIAMLGFDAGMPVSYDLWLTLGSLLLAIAATSFAFISVQVAEPSRIRLALAGLAMGLGICFMHYMGMAAMRAPATLSYDPWLVAASFAIAITVSWVALVAALSRPNLTVRLVGAVVLGLAIASMHYTAMAAASFTPTPDAVFESGGLDQLSLAIWVGTGTMTLLFFALVSAMFDRRFEALALREAAAIATREAHLREVLTRMPIAVAVVPRGADDRIIFSNSLAWDMWDGMHPARLPLNDIEGRPLAPAEHPFQRAVSDGAPCSGQLVCLAQPDGRKTYLELSAAPLPAVAGKSEEVILTAQDVTARQEAEQALQQSQKLETIGHLTGGVAHDFNNLLTPIVGGLDMLRRDPAMGARAKRVIEGALQASNRAATLVQRLLAFARRQALQPRPTDMSAVLAGVRELIQRSVGPSIEVSVDAEPNLVARVDPAQLELAILNLAVNSRDAMPDGGVISISACAEELRAGEIEQLPAGRYVRLSVEDTGVGMDEPTLRRAVEPFFTTKGAGKGTGLGLSMVHGLAAQSSGAMRLWSRPGQGTRAELWLPCSEEEALAEAEETIGTRTKVAVEPITILVVDDEDLVRAATGEMLKEAGHQVIEASSGAEALAVLRERPDIGMVITDHLMPGMTGVALAREVLQHHAGVPVLIITGYAQPEELPPSLPRLRKPVLAQQLHAAVAELIHGRDEKVVPINRYS